MLIGLCIYIVCRRMERAPIMDFAREFKYGVAAPEEIARRTGKEILQAIIDGELPRPPIGETMSFWIAEVSDGFAAFDGEPGVHLLNPMGAVHGGWALTLIDSACGCAGLSLLPAGSGFATIETKANRSRPITPDPLPRTPAASAARDVLSRMAGKSFRRRHGCLVTTEAGDGTRILVDRLWPRGIAKDKARIELWLKDIAPSDALRKRFHRYPDEWDVFLAAYFVELDNAAARAAAGAMFERLRDGPVSLLYAARDEQRNNAVALRMWLDRQRSDESFAKQ